MANPPGSIDLTSWSMGTDIHFLLLVDVRLGAERRRVKRANLGIAHPHPARGITGFGLA